MSRAAKLVGPVAALGALALVVRRRRRRDPERLVRSYYEAWADGDPDAVRGLLDEDYEGHVHTLAGVEERGRDELGKLVASHADAFDRVEYEVHDVLRADGRVAARVTMRARHRETGRDGEIDGLVLLRLDGARIAEEWSSWDYLGLAQQLGLARSS